MDGGLGDEQARREELASRIIADAHRRAAAISYPGVRVNMLRVAEQKAEKVRAGLLNVRPSAQPKAEVRSPRQASKPPRLVHLEEPARATLRRSCLRCRGGFDSTGPGNRMCSTCRTKAHEVSPFAL